MAPFLLFLVLVLTLILPRRQVRAWGRCLVRLVLPVAILVVSVARVDLSHAAGGAPTAGKDAASILYRRYCQRCHGADGTGRQGAAADPLPVFTSRGWQERRTDVQLMVSILDGKGAGMPAFRGRFSEVQARSLIAHIRAFAPARSPTPATDSSAPAASADDFATQFRQLQKEYDGLQRQLKELDSAPRQHSRASVRAEEGIGDVEEAAKLVRTGGLLYRRSCQRCHGADGKGDREQTSSDDGPDFSSSAWQEQRNDARLLASILKGTEGGMPAFRRLSEAQAKALVAYIRCFALRSQTAPASPPATPAISTPHRQERQHQQRGIGRVIRGLSAPSLVDAIRLLDASKCVWGQSLFQAVPFPKRTICLASTSALSQGYGPGCISGFRAKSLLLHDVPPSNLETVKLAVVRRLVALDVLLIATFWPKLHPIEGRALRPRIVLPPHTPCAASAQTRTRCLGSDITPYAAGSLVFKRKSMGRGRLHSDR